MFCLTVASKPSVSGTPKLRFANSTQRSICTHASINKRDLILGAVAASGVTHFATLPAEAGWDGPAKFLKSRQQANASKLTAPIDVSLKRLQEAYRMIDNGSTDYDTTIRLVRTASCNCYSFEAFSSDNLDTKVSLVTQNFNLADPCTFRIIVKNTTILMDDNDSLKIETKEALELLIRSYQLLDDVLLSAGDVDSETEGKVAPTLERTIALQADLRDKVAQCIAQDA